MGNPLSRILLTDMNGVFASGDAEIGPLTVVACVGNAHRAAKVIQRWFEEGEAYLTDEDFHEDILSHLGVYDKMRMCRGWMPSSVSIRKKFTGKSVPAKVITMKLNWVSATVTPSWKQSVACVATECQ